MSLYHIVSLAIIIIIVICSKLFKYDQTTYSIYSIQCDYCLCQTNCDLLLADIEDLEQEIRELTGQMG